jgi:coproporphyrinogen III oxidase
MNMEKYYGQLRQTALDGFKKLNKTSRVEQKKWAIPAGIWEVSVVRGKVLEKATTTHIRLQTKSPATGEDTRFEVFQVKIYPASPKIPILLFNMENRAGREDHFAGFLDVAPVAASRGDLNFMQAGIKKLAEKHKEDYEASRKKLNDVYRMDSWGKAVNAAIGLRLEYARERADLVYEAGMLWLESFFTVAGKRKRESCTGKQEALMYSVRARIMEFYLLKDLSVRVVQQLGLPLDAVALGHFAPTIRY